jgi:aminodeoxychorismate lyase
MIVFVNGRFVPEAEALVSVFDRGFLYGDGLFETIRVRNGIPFRWNRHMDRLKSGAGFLRMTLPLDDVALRQAANELVARNNLGDALLRLALSRGPGPRGYSPREASNPTIVLSLHPLPAPKPAWSLITSSVRLPAADPLARFKTSNRLPQIRARMEADAAGADEALLLLDDSEAVAQGSSSNLFWIEGGSVCTTPLGGIVEGVTRATVIELCHSAGIKLAERSIAMDPLKRSEGVFLTLSSQGIVEAASLDRAAVRVSDITNELRRAYAERLERETG